MTIKTFEHDKEFVCLDVKALIAVVKLQNDASLRLHHVMTIFETRGACCVGCIQEAAFVFRDLADAVEGLLKEGKIKKP